MNVPSSAINRKVRKVILTNFQSHKLTTFYLEDGLNIISGSNDNGKTACARALSWVLHNSPIEDVIRRQNNIQTKFCQVEIEFFDGAIIKRYKSKTLNKIEFKYPEEENFTGYQGFNNKYPDVVWEFLQYPPIFKNEKLGPIAYADQSKKHFLIDIPPGSLPEIISSIIGVDDLDKASKQINSLILEENKKIIFLEKSLEELTEKEAEDFSTLDDDAKTYNILLQTYNEIEALENDADELQKYIDKFNVIISKNKEYVEDISKCQKTINVLSDKIESIETLSSELSNINSLDFKITDHNNNILKAEFLVETLSPITDPNFINNINFIDSVIKEIDEIELFTSKLDTANDNVVTAELVLAEIETELSSKQIELDNLIKEIKDNNIACDTCNTVGGVKI